MLKVFYLLTDFLKTKQCLTAGITEELEVAIEGEDTCNPEYVTISVEPTVSVIKLEVRIPRYSASADYLQQVKSVWTDYRTGQSTNSPHPLPIF